MISPSRLAGFEDAIRESPYDPGLRLIYYDFLLEHDMVELTHRQKWLADILEGKIKYLLTITRNGFLPAASHRKMDNPHWRKWAPRYLRGDNGPFLLVDFNSKTGLGLKAEQPVGPDYTSPVLFHQMASHRRIHQWRVWPKALLSSRGRLLQQKLL